MAHMLKTEKFDGIALHVQLCIHTHIHEKSHKHYHTIGLTYMYMIYTRAHKGLPALHARTKTNTYTYMYTCNVM